MQSSVSFVTFQTLVFVFPFQTFIESPLWIRLTFYKAKSLLLNYHLRTILSISVLYPSFVVFYAFFWFNCFCKSTCAHTLFLVCCNFSKKFVDIEKLRYMYTIKLWSDNFSDFFSLFISITLVLAFAPKVHLKSIFVP